MSFFRSSLLVLALPLVLSGCLSFSSSSPPRETLIIPPGTTLVCSNGTQPPC